MVALVGHSFVSGLEQHLKNNTNGSDLGVNAAARVGVTNLVSSIQFHGMRGARVLDLFQLIPILIQAAPGVLLLDIGTNDITQGFSAPRIAKSLGQLLKTIRTFYDGVICILSVVPRASGLGFLSPRFLKVSAEIEVLLKCLTHSHHNLLYHKQKGFYEVEENGVKKPLSPWVWSRDGIHPNNQLGRKKYLNSLRLAISKSVKMASR